MHDGCTGMFDSGKEVVAKVRSMGFALQFLPIPLPLTCVECGEEFEMNKFEDKCPNCNMVYGVVPCHAFDAENVKAAGIDF
jgi:Zn finger protein HypA/HybF involved in hydrogenase expression